MLTVVRDERTMLHPVVPAPALLPAHLRDVQADSQRVVVETDLWAVLVPFLLSLEQKDLKANMMFCFALFCS